MRTSSGIKVFIKGCFHAFKHPDLAIKGALFSALLVVICLSGVWFGSNAIVDVYFGPSADEFFWEGILRAVAWLALMTVGISLTPMVIGALLALMAPSLRSTLFDRITVLRKEQRRAAGHTIPPANPLSLAQSIRIDLYRIVFATIGSLIIASVGIFAIPFWGGAQFVFTIWCMGVDTIGLDHERRGRKRREQDTLNRAQWPLVLGVGCITFALYLIPILQFAAPMLVTAGAAELSIWRER